MALTRGVYITSRANNWTVFLVNNLVMVNERKACDMSKVAEFCQEKALNLYFTSFSPLGKLAVRAI